MAIMFAPPIIAPAKPAGVHILAPNAVPLLMADAQEQHAGPVNGNARRPKPVGGDEWRAPLLVERVSKSTSV